ncbi:MAG: icaC [Clostridia bacterium]|jgi:surface polysaccharide O-acyltransferase-like enzyme|nr:icaC [Clostridia bacterium]
MMKTRLKEFDYLRVTAVLAVIGIHVTSRFVTINSVAYLLNQAARFAVPLFIVLSGFLLYYSSMKGRNKTRTSFLSRRLSKIFIPYLIWTLIYMLYSIRNTIGNALSVSFFSAFLKHLVFGSAAPQLYFIIIILQMYLLYGLLERLMNSKYEKPLLIVSFLITAYISLGAYLFRWYIFIMPKLSFGYHIIFPTWLFYFVFGMYFAKHAARFKPVLAASRLKLGLLWVVGLGALYIDSRMSNTYGSSIKPTVMLYCIASFLFFYSALSPDSIKESTFIRWISEQSFFIYFSHVLLIELIFMVFRVMHIKLVWGSILGVALLMLLDTFASLALAYLLYRIPYSKYLGCTVRRLRLVE